jgi:hypothetical protein
MTVPYVLIGVASLGAEGDTWFAGADGGGDVSMLNYLFIISTASRQ